ncbi:hypothetical protein SAMN05444162_0394 [Paenibacillaceae bacterium GAS479]|nr:hypothetical protein SAMN05444162_0394 [Paenibacillaceae bacterium GAS479]
MYCGKGMLCCSGAMRSNPSYAWRMYGGSFLDALFYVRCWAHLVLCHRRVTEPSRRERYVPIPPLQLIRDAYKRSDSGSDLYVFAIECIYMGRPFELMNLSHELYLFAPITSHYFNNS